MAYLSSFTPLPLTCNVPHTPYPHVMSMLEAWPHTNSLSTTRFVRSYSSDSSELDDDKLRLIYRSNFLKVFGHGKFKVPHDPLSRTVGNVVHDHGEITIARASRMSTRPWYNSFKSKAGRGGQREIRIGVFSHAE